jgi:hypothetical protein
MKAFDKSRLALARQTGPILLFDGEVGRNAKALWLSFIAGRDEHSQTGILTSGLNLAPAFPVWWYQWLWESVTRYSGATVPDSHGVP